MKHIRSLGAFERQLLEVYCEGFSESVFRLRFKSRYLMLCRGKTKTCNSRRYKTLSAKPL